MKAAFLSLLLAFGGTWLTLVLLLRHFAHVVLDQPNARSLHATPIPRTGGLAMIIGIALAWAWLRAPLLTLALPVLLLIGISFLDDKFHIASRWRFLAHLGASALALWALWPAGLSFIWFVLLTLALAWYTNLYNFMDGADGLAGGMAVTGFGAYASAAWLGGNLPFALAAASLSCAALAFLWFNFHPAQVFMGDAGSIPLGFLAGSLGFYGWIAYLWPWWFPLLVFSPFVTDATITLSRRLLRGEKVWQAHREHYYQRLILLGLGHRKTALLEYACMLAVAVSAVWGLHQSNGLQATLLGFWAVIYFAIARMIDRRWCAKPN